MRHLEDEDIARMIEGNIDKKEREHFLKHLSECDSCLGVYTETLKFVEEERKSKAILKFPNLGEIADRFRQAIGTMFPKKRLIPVAAALIIILLMVPFALNELHQRRIRNAQVGFIADSVNEMETYAFSPSKDKIYAAVRAGIFIEDISLLVNTGGNEELKTKITKMLSSELKIFISEKSSLPQSLANIDRKNYETVVQRIRELMEKQSLSELFEFGCFVEYSILSTFENKTPNLEDIDKYQQIANEFDLPQGVFKELNKLKPTIEVEKSKNICIAIKQIFLE